MKEKRKRKDKSEKEVNRNKMPTHDIRKKKKVQVSLLVFSGRYLLPWIVFIVLEELVVVKVVVQLELMVVAPMMVVAVVVLDGRIIHQ